MDTNTRVTRQEALGAFIRERRIELKLTQTQLAERVGWVQERISLLENGKYGMPSLPALERLAGGLEIPLFDMLAASGYTEGAANAIGESGQVGASGAASIHTLQRLLSIPTTSLRETLNGAANLVTEIMHADKVDALMYEPKTASLVALGTSNTSMGRRQIEIGMNRLPLANGGREVEVFETGVPFTSGQAGDDPEMLVGMTKGLGIQSIIIVPLNVSENTRGVLVAESSRTDQFNSDDVSFVELLAHWIGIIAERAELAENIAVESTERAKRTAAEELMTVLAHDLGNHLTPLRGHIDLLRRRAVRDGRPEDVRGADEASHALTRMQQLIEDLLDASRLEGGVFSLSMAQIDLVGLAREVAERFQEEEHPINLRLPEAMTLQGDASRICQALENLLSNAVHHGPTGVPIHLYVGEEERSDGEWAVIEVRDTGPGIAAELLPSLFDRFSKDSSSQGLGLGLYLARGIAHAHGGDLAVDSQVGRGSTFRLTLPLEVR